MTGLQYPRSVSCRIGPHPDSGRWYTWKSDVLFARHAVNVQHCGAVLGTGQGSL